MHFNAQIVRLVAEEEGYTEKARGDAQEDPQSQHNKHLQRQKIKWANPFRNKTNQSTKSFRNAVFNNKNNAAQSSGKFIKRGFNGLGGTHKVHMTKKKSLITNHMLMKEKNQQKNGEQCF